MQGASYSIEIQQITRQPRICGPQYRRIEEDAMGILPDNKRDCQNKEKESLTEIKDFVETTIVIKKESKGLGVEIVGGADTYLKGIIIKDIDPNGSAATDGRLKSGDQILEVNGVSLKEIVHDKAVSTLRVASSPVRLVVFREDPEKIFTSKENPKSLIKVCMNKSISECFGLSILGRRDGHGVFVTYVAEGSVAGLEGTIHQGDRIIEVNNIDLRNATQEHAANTLKRCYGNIMLTIGRIPSLYSSLKTSENTTELPSSRVNYGLDGENDSTVLRYRSGSHGSNDWLRKSNADENRNKIGNTRQRRSLTMNDSSMYYHEPYTKDSRQCTEVKPTSNVDSELSRGSTQEWNMRKEMYETYGKEDYV